MKGILAIAVFALALSLCHPMGKRENANSNSRPSGEMAESSPTPPPNANEAPSEELRGRPGTGVPGGMPTTNHNSAAEVPPPPAKPTPPKPNKTVVSGGVLNGKAITKPQPAYPPIAKAARASGTVVVQVLVDEKGNVVSASAVSGHPLLQQSAVSAARQWKFTPTLLSGQPVKVSGVITFNFVLQ